MHAHYLSPLARKEPGPGLMRGPVSAAPLTGRGKSQLRAVRAGPLEFFHCPMLSVMIFTEASAACVACA
jgi:hypothetical protein